MLRLHVQQEVFRLETPGGGGFGDPDMNVESIPPAKKMKIFEPTGSVANYKSMQESV